MAGPCGEKNSADVPPHKTRKKVKEIRPGQQMKKFGISSVTDDERKRSKVDDEFCTKKDDLLEHQMLRKPIEVSVTDEEKHFEELLTRAKDLSERVEKLLNEGNITQDSLENIKELKNELLVINSKMDEEFLKCSFQSSPQQSSDFQEHKRLLVEELEKLKRGNLLTRLAQLNQGLNEFDILADVIGLRREFAQTNDQTPSGSEPDFECWYHKTSAQHAEGIRKNGIHLKEGKNKDFSHGGGFYLTDSLRVAMSWKRIQSHSDDWAILYYNIPKKFFETERGIDLRLKTEENEKLWKQIVKFYRSGDARVDEDGKTRKHLLDRPFIVGPWSTGDPTSPEVLETHGIQCCLCTETACFDMDSYLQKVAFIYN